MGTNNPTQQVTGAVRRFIIILMHRVRGNHLSYLKKLQSWQWLSSSNIHLLQMERIKKLILHSYHHVPFYHDVLSTAGVINKSNSVTLRNFKNIPFLDKKTIHDHFEDLRSDDLSSREWYQNASGGSTGQPTRLIQDGEYNRWRDALKILFDEWTGYAIGERKLLLWGSERDLFGGKEKFLDRFGRWLRNEVCFNTFRMTLENMDNCINTINRFKPVQILAYVEGIYELSRFIRKNRLEVYAPGAILSTAGTLYPKFRETIEKALNTDVYNRYGSREVGDIACECSRHRGLHVCVPTHYVEILRDDGSSTEPGEIGEIVITLLTNYAMPLIRYRIGDSGVWSEESCTCGRSWPLLKNVTGRVDDTFITKAGARVDGGFFTQLLYFHDWIQKFQIVQEDYEKIRFIIIPYEKNHNHYQIYSNELNEITKKIKVVMGESCEVDFEFVNDIHKTPSGKYRYVISKVAGFGLTPFSESADKLNISIGEEI